MRARNTCARSQRGAALVMALLVVSLATVTAVGIASALSYSLQRSGNLLELARARDLADAAEFWVRTELRAGMAAPRNEDRPSPAAPDPAPALPEPPAWLTGHRLALGDAQGCLNVNNLLREGAPDPVTRRRFERLLAQLDVNPELLPALLDWLDTDSEPRPGGGAEDDHYSRRDPPYRAANAPLGHPSELRLLRHADTAALARLLPHLCALPEHTQVNVNHASAAVLRALGDDISERSARRLAAAAREQPFLTLDAFLAHPALARSTLDAEDLGVSSRYRWLQVDIRLQRLDYRRLTLLREGIVVRRERRYPGDT